MAVSFLRQLFGHQDQRCDQPLQNRPEELDAEAQFQLALKYATGEGVTQDHARAAEHYTAAAEKNHKRAQFTLAMLYRKGLGVARDKAKALLWLNRAANLGDASAQYTLGVQQHLSCRGQTNGASAEARIEALKWVRLAAAQDYSGATAACEFVALAMTREEVTEGNRRAASFISGNSDATTDQLPEQN